MESMTGLENSQPTKKKTPRKPIPQTDDLFLGRQTDMYVIKNSVFFVFSSSSDILLSDKDQS